MNNLDEQFRREDRLDAITSRIGFALWQLQELEGVAAIYFVMTQQATVGMGVTAGQALVEKAQAGTFGTIVKKLIKTEALTPELNLRFEKLLAERNWLVHNSRKDSRPAVHNDGAANLLLDRIDGMKDEAGSLLRELEILSSTHVRKFGISEEEISAEADQLLDQWHGKK